MVARRRPNLLVLSAAVGVAVILGIGLTVGVGLAMRDRIPIVGAEPTATSSIVEPATADPLPVVGETEAPVGSDAQVEPAPGSPILVVQGDPQPQGSAFVPAPGLDNRSDTAAGYRFDDLGMNRAAFTAVLARKFGIPGRPVRQADGSWTVRSTVDGLAQVRVDPGPMVGWSFEARPDRPVPQQPPTPGADPDTVARTAEAITGVFLADLGVPIKDLDWQVELIDGDIIVTGWQVIADQRTTAGWQVTFDRAGEITAASGFAATPVELADLPVLGAAAALERAGRPRWSTLGPSLITPAADTAASQGPTSVTSPSPRTITAAELTLAQLVQPDGRLLVLPAYLLTADDGSTWSLVAVADQALHLVPGRSSAGS